jgi:hypothetical protein
MIQICVGVTWSAGRLLEDSWDSMKKYRGAEYMLRSLLGGLHLKFLVLISCTNAAHTQAPFLPWHMQRLRWPSAGNLRICTYWVGGGDRRNRLGRHTVYGRTPGDGDRT